MTRIVKNILVKTPQLSGAYHTPNKFFVVSYEEHDGNRELVSQSFTNIGWARDWIRGHHNDFEGELQIHLAEMIAEVIETDTVASYS